MGYDPDIITIDGEVIARRVWASVLDAASTAGIPYSLIELVQGSYSGSSVSASGSTHDGGGAYDLRLRGISGEEAVKGVIALRQNGSCAWPRIPAYGWDEGRHIHGLDRFEPDLSASAQWQVGEYDAHRNALSGSSSAHDPIPHPQQTKYEEADMALDAADIARIAEAVWASKTTDPVTLEKEVTERTMLARTRINASQAAKKQAGAGGVYVLTEADKNDIAKRTADLIAARLTK